MSTSGDKGSNAPLPGMQPAAAMPRPQGPLAVTLQRSDLALTDDVAFWALIRRGTERLSFNNYLKFMDDVCGWDPERVNRDLRSRLRLPFARVELYELLKAATELFLVTSCDVTTAPQFDAVAESARLGRAVSATELEELWKRYTASGDPKLIPYMDYLKAKLREPLTAEERRGADLCASILEAKLQRPCMIELIWSYWHEEAMLVQALNAISLRFQNRMPGERGVLANLTLDPLRPLSSLMWGYVQDEQHRLSIARRAYEYDHEYGLQLVGSAVPKLDSADRRSKFLEGFHRLLHVASRFYQQDDDTTVRADGFPVLNALKDVNLMLGEGGQNQYGDLPWVARGEMLMQQWMLARPEMREFLSSRPSVIYPEPWMERLDAVKHLMRWNDVSSIHFNNLAVMGERLLLSIRLNPWSAVNSSVSAANWARSWREEVQGYLHAYRVVTGVDLSANLVANRIDATIPGVLIQRRLVAQNG